MTRLLPDRPPTSGVPHALCEGVVRLTAPNPGRMTGPGTNSYLLGNSKHGFVVVDPGPALAVHTEALLAHSVDTAGRGGFSHAIVCTHSHADHAPGAWPLQQGVTALGRPAPPVWGLPSGPHARPGCHFLPDLVAVDGAQLALPHGLPTIEFLYTPGHASNHLCLCLPDTAHSVVLSGDHVLQGSSTVIDPPDGNMGDYLASLEKLSNACTHKGITHILPAHGGVIAAPVQAIQALRAHRSAREATIRAAMQAQPHGTPESWLPIAYADVAPALWPVAMRSLLAHIEHIQKIH